MERRTVFLTIKIQYCKKLLPKLFCKCMAVQSETDFAGLLIVFFLFLFFCFIDWRLAENNIKFQLKK